MSVETDEQMTNDQESSEQIDASQLAEAGASDSTDTTQVDAETDKVEVEQIDLEALAGSQPETTEKERNNLFAANRVKTKRLKELEAQLEAGNIPQGHEFKPEGQGEKPKVADFVNDDVLYDKFGGSENVALAAYQEAKEDWNAHGTTVGNQTTAHNKQMADNVRFQIAQEETFEGNIDKHRKTIKGLDDSLASAEKIYGEGDFNAIRDAVGDNAPLVLAVLGSNNGERDALAAAVATNNQAHIIKHLTRLEDKILNNLPSVNKISKANSETPLGGGSNDTGGNLQAKIDKAASAGDIDEYQRLKKIQKGS